MRFDLTDKEWAIIEPLLPPTRQGGQRVDDRRVLSGIFYALRTGIPWDDLPDRYGPHTTVYNRFNRWAKESVWQSIFEGLQARCPASVEMIDSTTAKNPSQRGPRFGGASLLRRLILGNAPAFSRRAMCCGE